MGQYPSRMSWRHTRVEDVEEGAVVAVRGRILQLEGRSGHLADPSGAIAFVLAEDANEIGLGDIVELYGQSQSGELAVSAYRLLAAARADWSEAEWDRFHQDGDQLRRQLQMRSAICDAVRRFFANERFVAVETPTLVGGTAQEEHIALFATEYERGGAVQPLYLAPSPELHMKRLLGSGCERIYQLGRSYRNGEVGALHNPEFTLLEWYRAFASYEEIMVDVEKLVSYVAVEVGGSPIIRREGREIDLTPPWPRLTVGRAFVEWAGIELEKCADAAALYGRARELDFASAEPDDSWEDLFHKILLEKIEPELAALGAVHLIDYPSALAALAKFKEGVPGIAERAEAYVGGVELTNGYTELNDPVEQRRRFGVGTGEGRPPLDEDFLAAMDLGIPPAGGVALGIDRLVMLIAGASGLDEVIAFPYRPVL